MNSAIQTTIRPIAGAIAFALTLTVAANPATGTALDDYVAAPDANYSFSLANTISGTGYTAYVLDMKSQKWRTAAEVDRPVWQHWLIIFVPDTILSNTALLFIDGGSNGGSAPTSVDPTFGAFAVATNSVIAQLKMVPNERLKFTDELDARYVDDGRTEDQIIAYTFDKFLATGDGTWPLLCPMVKSAVRAMDTVQTYVPTVTMPTANIANFVISGGSKRGWTTWLTGAVDGRVAAIVPAVIDVLNMDDQMDHHYAAYGFFSPAIQDYVDLNVMTRLASPGGQALRQIVDPYEYRDRFDTMPKYLVNSTGDEFFVSDSAQFYFHDLPGEKHLRYIPNTGHGLDGSDVFESLLIYYQSVLFGVSRPQFSWEVLPDGTIRVETVDTPAQVNLWQATNPAVRIFVQGFGVSTWTSSPLSDQGGGVYLGSVPIPATGWTAYMVELIFDSGTPIPYKFTTEVHVVPEVLPFKRVADNDADGDVDGVDFKVFAACYNRAGNPPRTSACPPAAQDLFDYDDDNDVDLEDFATFARCFNKAGNPPRLCSIP